VVSLVKTRGGKVAVDEASMEPLPAGKAEGDKKEKDPQLRV